jgi:hypothetical protein
VSSTTDYTVVAANTGGSVSFDVTITVNDIAPNALAYDTPNVFTVDTAIAPLNPTISGDNLVFTVIPALPAGLSIDAATGVISGTPTVVSTASVYTVTATNSGGSVWFDVEITVNDAMPNGLSYNSPNVFTVGSAIVALNPTVLGENLIFSISPELPDGLSIDVATGVISGTPTTSAVVTGYTVTATNSGGSASFDVVITVNDPAPTSLHYQSPNIYTVGTAITILVPATTGGPILGYSVSPALPDGLILDATTGIISGTPTTVTPAAIYTVTATNTGGSVTFELSITINDVAPDGLSYNSPNVFTAGSVIAELAPVVSGGEPTGFSVSPALPAGLSIDAVTGVISGTPTTVSPTAAYTVTATNSGGAMTFDVIITVNDVAPMDLVYTSPNILTVGIAMTDLFPGFTGQNLVFSAVDLPAGLSIDSLTGAISGTPTSPSIMATATVTATNSGGSVSTDVVFIINDAAPIDLSYNSPNVYTAGATIADLVPSVTGENLVFSVSPDLPAGLSFDTATGIISGTPEAATVAATYTVTATNSGGSVSFGIDITVNDAAPLALSYNSPNVYTAGATIADLVPSVTGENLVFSVSPDLPAGLSFDTATGIISGTPTAVTPTAAYTVTASNSGGSVSFDVIIKVDEALGIDNPELHVGIYPNPFLDYVELVGLNGDAEFKLFAMDGRQIRSGRTDAARIDFGQLPNGVYLLQVTKDKLTVTKRIIKK